jgi:GrpB-like predicted nucleotidyltransferase (UPF0157 family)
VILRDHRLSRHEIEAAEARGYEYRGEQGIERREYFSRRTPPPAHIHALPADHPEGRMMLLFRDYLRAHPDVARGYEVLKRRLAVEFAGDRPAYTDAKAAFVAEVIRLATPPDA